MRGVSYGVNVVFHFSVQMFILLRLRQVCMRIARTVPLGLRILEHQEKNGNHYHGIFL